MLRPETCPSGARLLIDPAGPQPVAAVQLWLRVGAAWEVAGEVGAAHLLEHMLFKGAGRWGVGALTAEAEALGGDLNAWTSHEQTCLHLTLPAAAAPAAVELLCTMAFAPTLDAAELEREKAVVIEEIRGADDDGSSLLQDALRKRVFGRHPYGRPVLGTAASVRRIGRDALAAFHARWYTPANAILVVCGPVDEAAVRAAAAPFLGRAVAPVPPRPPRTAAKGQAGAFLLDGGFEERTVELAFPIPGAEHPDIAALDLLAAGLGAGRASPLGEALREREDLASSVWSAIEEDGDGGMFVVGCAPRPGKAGPAARALAAVVAAAVADGPPVGAMRRARASVRADRVRDGETVDGRAHRLGWALAVHGGLDAELRHEAAMERLRPAEVQAVAARWLQPSRAVLAVLAPASDLDAPVAALAPAAASPVPPPPRRAGPSRVRFALDNGLQVVVQPEPDAGTVALALHGVGGSLLESPGTAGLATAWGRLLTRGAGPLDAAAFSGALGDLSSVVWGWGGRSTGGVAASGPAEAAEALLRLLADVVLAPRFDADERARVRADLREEQSLAADDPSGLAFDTLVSAAWAGHPWGHPELGTPATVRAVGAAALREMHRRQMVGANLTLAVTGAVEAREIEAWVRRLFRRVPVGQRVVAAPPTAFAGGQRVERQLLRAGAPSAVCIGFPAPGLFEADEPVFRVLRGILSGATGGGGRLFHQLREVRGLCYSVGATLQSGLGAGLFTCQVEADPARADEAEAALWAELDALASGGPLPELERVKQGIVEGLVLDGQRASSRAERLAEAERYGPGADAAEAARHAVAQVGAAAVQAAARALRRENAVAVRVSAGGARRAGAARRRGASAAATMGE